MIYIPEKKEMSAVTSPFTFSSLKNALVNEII